MPQKKPPPAFEVRFVAPGLYPESIQLSVLSKTLAAVQRLAGGAEPDDESEQRAVGGTDILRLQDVKRGSARFICSVDADFDAVARLKLTGERIQAEDGHETLVDALLPIESLSQIAARLGCTIELTTPNQSNPDVIARICPDTFERISGTLLLSGSLTVIGTVQRVGGSTEPRCALRLSNQQKLLYCSTDRSTAQALAAHLYDRVVCSGTGRWIRQTQQVISLRITGFEHTQRRPVGESLARLHRAGGSAWDKIRDTEAFVASMRDA